LTVATAQQHRLFAFFHIAACTGARCGELLNLRDLRITRVFSCVARGFKARLSFMFAGCFWWRSLAVDGSSGTRFSTRLALSHVAEINPYIFRIMGCWAARSGQAAACPCACRS
jgi:hypothetical protein